MRGVTEQSPTLTRAIMSLAIPALGTLIAAPIFVLIDSAMVGHLGTEPLAGLAVASTVLTTVVGIFVFLLFSTTTRAAQAYGRRDIPQALMTGIQSLYLALVIGVVLGCGLLVGAPWIVSFFDAAPQAVPHAHAYLRASAPGVVGMFVVMAATGTLRGLHDTRSSLVVASVGAVLNTVLNALFIFVFQWGVAGSGAGTSITQILMGMALVVLLWRRGRVAYAAVMGEATAPPLRSQVSLRPSLGGVVSSWKDGFPLLIRTIGLRVALLAVVAVVSGMGVTALAAHHIVSVVWAFASYALDSLAVASQTLFASSMGARQGIESQEDTPADLGAPDTHKQGEAGGDVQVPSWALSSPHALLKTLTIWGVGSGLVLGLVLASVSWLLPRFFSTDPQVWGVATVSLLLAAATMPIAGLVFLYDGVMMGADRTVYLAVTSLALLLIHIPALCAVSVLSAHWGPTAALALLWTEFGFVFMGGRAVFLWFGSRELRTETAV